MTGVQTCALPILALSPDSIKANVDPSPHQRATLCKVNYFLYESLVSNPMSGMLLHAPTVPIPRFEPKEPPPWEWRRQDKKKELFKASLVLSAYQPVLPDSAPSHRYHRPRYWPSTGAPSQLSALVDKTISAPPVLPTEGNRYYRRRGNCCLDSASTLR